MMQVTAKRGGRRTAHNPNQGSLFDDLDLAPAPEPAAPDRPVIVVPTVPSGTVARIRANLAAIATLRALQADGHAASPDETTALAAWSGWGAAPEMFDPSHAGLRWAREELANLLDEPQIAAASRSTLNAHYTDPRIVNAMWDAVASLGFGGGRVLEPGCGSGNFLATAPAGADMTGVELDPTTAAIAQARCPAATVVARSFADMRLPDGAFDLVIGNVPFGKITLHDPVHNKGRHSIHNHFIVKALHLTRPGGLAAVLTSRYTLDAADAAARREIHALADLVSAVRLPSDAHRETAGTRVVTDLLIFRRREPGRDPARAYWLRSMTLLLDGAEVPVNACFEDGRGGTVLGTLRATTGAYRAGDLTVDHDGADWLASLGGALATDTARAVSAGLAWTPGTQAAPVPEPEASDVQDGHILHRGGGRFVRAERGAYVPLAVPKTQAKELAALLGVRDAALAVLGDESRTPEDSPRLANLRATLSTRYEAYVAAHGHLNRITQRRTGRFHPETGEELLARIRPPMGGFRADPHAPLVFALEDYDPESATATTAPILNRRVIVPRIPATEAETPADALAVCLDAHARVDIDAIAGLLSMSAAQARLALGTLVFDDPETGVLVPAAEYLSGDVRAKLRAATAAGYDDPAFNPNVAALREVQPADLTPGEIDGRLGAAWIDADIVRGFLSDILEDPSVAVEHPGGQVWAVDGRNYTVRARATWGTKRYPAPDLAQAILEQRRIEVKDPIGEGRYVLNVEETAAAMEKATEMQERFAEWLWDDPRRAAKLAAEYNSRFNAIALRSYDGARLSLPGLSAAAPTLHDHQHSAVARIIAEPAVLLAHDVGAGKTLEMICGAMELRRLGLVRKPCVVVPNHMLDQFAGEWLRAYPLARILITRQEDLQGDNRRHLVARVATGDWDAVIMSRSAFERIPLTPAAQAAYLERETDQLKAWLDVARKGKGRTVKRLEAALLRATERVKAKIESGKKDAGIHFEDTGIDYLFVDEAHGYKNLRTASSINGAAIEGSLRATDMDMKIGWLRGRNGDRVVTYATATPIANSITEVAVMQRYLRPDLLQAAGIDVFDTWAATFGQLVTEVELAPEGGGTFRLNTRFARFRNVPELLRLFHVVADVKTADDLALPVPLLAFRDDGKRAVHTVTVPASPALAAYVSDLGDRAVKIRNREVNPRDDNMLKVTSDGRAAALHMRLVGGVQDEPGKVDAAAVNIHHIWEANRLRAYAGPDGQPSPARGSLQLVFCDLGTPRDGWSVYRELRDQLVALGMPAGLIRFIHDAKTDRDKAMLFAACRAGSVAVLVGSTEKMGVGTNVQARAIALHHLDAPWRPADVAQRDGRIMRQGNLNPEVSIFRYVTSGSFDGYMWQTLERKARFIASVMRGRLDVREIEDVGDTALSYAEVKALATGNPLLMEQAKAANVLATLQRAERAHNRNQSHLKGTIRDQGHRAVKLREEADQCDIALALRTDVSGDQFTMMVAGQRYEKRTDAGFQLSETIRGMIRTARDTGTNQETTVGALAGFPVRVRVLLFIEVLVIVSLEGAPGVKVEVGSIEAKHGMGLLKRLENRIGRLEEHKVSVLDQADRCDDEVAHAIETLDAPFPRAVELAAAVAEAARVAEALQALTRKDTPAGRAA
jgi:N12 class adenine-specific DNA methylase/SAM-dependent methyltransferase